MELVKGKTLADAPSPAGLRARPLLRHRDSPGRCGGGRAPAGHHPPGSQAGQRHDRRRRPDQGARLRTGQGDGRGPEWRRAADAVGDTGRPHRRDAGVHVSRAGAGRARRHPLGHLLAGHRLLRDVDRPTAVRGRATRPRSSRRSSATRHVRSPNCNRRCRARSRGSWIAVSRRTPSIAFSRRSTFVTAWRRSSRTSTRATRLRSPVPLPRARRPTTMAVCDARAVVAALVAVVGVWLGVGRDDRARPAVPQVRNPVQVTSALDVESYPTLVT